MNLVNLSIQQTICLAIIVISIIISVRKVLFTSNLTDVVEPVLSGCSTIITFFIVLAYYEKFDLLVGNLLGQIFQNSIKDNGLVHIVLLVTIFGIIKLIIYSLFRILHSFSLNNAINKLRGNKPFLVIFSLIFGFIRGLVFIVLLCIPLVLYNNLAEQNNRIHILDGLKAYDRMEEMIDSKRIQIISNGLKENISSNKITYYNGVTLDEGVRSNSQIAEKAKSITSKANNDREKARSIYRWVGSNIKYDDEKANKVMDNSRGYESGAIPAFKDRTGICFDYACLFTAMSKDVGLKSRIIVGEAYNGDEYVSHAWNQVYLEDEKKWIKVDPTFYVAGNYFDNANFDSEHRQRNIAGEF